MSGFTQQSGGGINVGMSQQPNYAGPIAGVDQGGMTYRNQQGDWSQFFGPGKGPIETAPYGSYRRENFALPDAYRGSNVYLTNVIITLVTDQELWPVKVALPWRLTESEMEISWDQIIFDNTLLGQVPEEGVSRLVTQQISERRDHYVRYGLAFMLEHGEPHTAHSPPAPPTPTRLTTTTCTRSLDSSGFPPPAVRSSYGSRRPSRDDRSFAVPELPLPHVRRPGVEA